VTRAGGVQDKPSSEVETTTLLVEQPALKLQLAGSASAESRLNFTPRKRPPPRVVPKGEYEF